MNQLLSIVDDGLIIKKLSVQTLEGPVQATDDIRVQGNIFVDRDIKAKRNVEVAGVLTVDTLKVKNLISEGQETANSAPAINPEIDFTFVGKAESQLDGKGLIWLDSQTGSKQLVYKEGNKLWSTMNIDLAKDRAFQINKLNVLTATELGSSVVRSNLRKVGELEGLRVSGQVEFDNWVFFNSYNNTFGINTDNPNGTVGIVVDNNVEVIVGSKEVDVAAIGTFTSNSLDIITDNKTRISVKDTGDVIFGNAKFKNAVVKIHGRLEVDELYTSSGEGGQSSVTFKNTDTSSVYGKGIVWNQDGVPKQLVYLSNPDRLFTSEVLDIGKGKWYSVGTNMVLSLTTLGSSVTESSLEKLGRLRELEVIGSAKFLGQVNAPIINSNQIETNDSFRIRVGGDDDFKIDTNGTITIGNEENTNRDISIYGRVSFNSGFSISKKRIITGTSSPQFGRWSQGDICYNEQPQMEGYVGWVCVQTGEPGKWCPFGLIMPVRG